MDTSLKYLKDGQYYIDLYDLHTIKECLNSYSTLKNKLEKKRNLEEFKNFSGEEFNAEISKAVSYYINLIKMQRYKLKKEVIKRWTAKDLSYQEKIDKASSPEGILCKYCSFPTELIFKDLWHSYEEDSKILFFFECTNCKKRQGLYDDGTEWRYKVSCPECGFTLNHKSNASNNVITTLYSCPNCSYQKEEVTDYNKEDKEWEDEKKREKNLLSEYRKEFCLDDKTGEEMLRFYEQMSKFVTEIEEKRKKDKDPLYQKARHLKKLSFIQLEKLIAENTEREGYKDLKFGKPEMGRFVTVDFSIIETREDRKEYNSQNTLKKLIKDILKNTNWRLMSEGINYRIGILTGRLKAYEQEEDLAEILKKENN